MIQLVECRSSHGYKLAVLFWKIKQISFRKRSSSFEVVIKGKAHFLPYTNTQLYCYKKINKVKHKKFALVKLEMSVEHISEEQKLQEQTTTVLKVNMYKEIQK